jgi:choline monooxygenase
MQLEEIVGVEALAEINRSTGEALGLPASAYSQAFYELENRYLLPRTWAVVAMGAEIPNPGDVLPVQLGDWPILLVRNEEGTIRAFLNICRHRGMRIVDKAVRSCEVLRCPWHNWTYGLDGRLLRRPKFKHRAKDECESPEFEEFDLKPVEVGLWHDKIFVNIAGNAAPFAEHRKPLDALFADYDLAGLRYGGHWEHFYEGNWKIAMEGGIESYHVPYGHAQYMRGVVDYEEHAVNHAQCYAMIDSRVVFGPGADPLTVLGNSMPVISKREVDGEATTYIGNLFPTGFIQTFPNLVTFGLMTPVGWNRTRIVLYFYYAGEAAADPALAEERAVMEKEWELVFTQDDFFVSRVHDNLKVRDQAGIRLRFSPYWEGAVHHFQKMVVETIQREQELVR